MPGESQVEPLVAKTVVSGACSASAVGNQGIGGVSAPCPQDGDVLPVSSSGAADHGVLESHKPTAAPEPHNPVLLSASPLAQIPSGLPCAVGRSDAAAEGVALNASKLFSDGSDDDALSLSEAEAEGFQCSRASRVARVPPHPGMFPNSPSATEVSTSAAGLPCVAAVQVVHRGPLDGPRDDEVVSLSSSGGEEEGAFATPAEVESSGLPGLGCCPSPPASGIPESVRSPPLHLPADTSRFFLDICSGATSPLASAAVARGIPAIPIDILRNPAHDLLDVVLFEQILRVAFSGRIAMGHGSPPCCEYSLLRLRPGGPPPCRCPQHLNGLPTNDAAANARVTQSRVILERTVAILYAVYQSGGHASLEQLRNSMSWSEPAAQGFMLDISADLVVVAACEFEMPFDKHWLFATSWRPLQSLQSVCPHAAGFHESFAGVQDASGDFLSRKTATFPNALAQRYVELIAPLFPGVVAPASEVTLEQATASVPVRPEASFPRACQDGGGIYSVPDWASPPPGTSDVFKTLRRDLMQLFASTKAPLRLRKQVAEGRAEPLFSESEVVSLRACWGSWFREQGFTQEVDWSVAKGQPYALNALEVLAQALQDRDVSLWPALRDGVPTGVERDIPPSHTFIPVPCSEEETDPEDFRICAGNWPGAEADPSLLEEMVQAELEAGYIEPVDSLDEARRRWPRVAVGKANIVKAPGRKPRLIVDPTVSGANPACVIPERFTLPGLSDIQAGFPIRACSEEVGGFSLDIAAAHKTVRVREAERVGHKGWG